MSVPNRPTEYSYNTTGNLVGVTSPNGLARTYTRDAADRLTGVTADEKNFAYEYYGDGLIKSITYPGGNIVTTYIYDNAKRITKLETKNGSNVLKTYSYKYDDVGNITSVSGSESAVYTYDELNRLKTATENGYTVTYEYDNRNNLISETRDDGYVKTYEYSGDNRLTKTTENGTETLYEYDLNGNLIKRGDDEFAYDSNDKLVYSKVNGVESVYKIGEDGLRRAKITSGITTTYSIDENGNVITEGNDEIIIGNVPLAKKIDGQYYYYIYNAHGDVVMIVDESGSIKNTYRYDAWGAIVSETETINNSHKYAGQYYDDDTGLIYLRARYYDPQDRRFTQEDPARDELNWYAYCGNNPVMFVDLTGESASGTAFLAAVGTCAVDGVITGAIYKWKGEPFGAGFINGFVSCLGTEAGAVIGAKTGHPYIGIIIGNSIGEAAGSMVETIMRNEVYGDDITIEEAAESAAQAAATGIISGVGSSYIKYAIELADAAGSAAKTLTKYDEKFGKALEVFFDKLSTILSSQ